MLLAAGLEVLSAGRAELLLARDSTGGATFVLVGPETLELVAASGTTFCADVLVACWPLLAELGCWLSVAAPLDCAGGPGGTSLVEDAPSGQPAALEEAAGPDGAAVLIGCPTLVV